MTHGTVHIAGAGLSGLSAAVALAARGVRVALFEASGSAGGRCRSYRDPALGQTIDNGNHLILSGNRAVHEYLRAIGSEQRFAGPAHAEFAFADLKSGARWTVRANDGAMPWWTLSKKRRVPGTRAADYLELAKLMRPGEGQPLDALYSCRGVLWERMVRPFLLAALNLEPERAASVLVAAVAGETLAKGGRAFRPRIAYPNLAEAFVDPAIAFLTARGADIRFGQRVTRLVFDGERASALEFAQTAVALAENDAVILAVPPPVASSLVPGLETPGESRAILSGHFRIAPPPSAAPMTGVLGGTVEWVFAFPERVSVTVSDAGRLMDEDRMELARTLWREAADVLGLPGELPPWQIVKEKRATFAATPEQEAKRPGAASRYRNLFLAGDWTDTGLPATIEGAVRSGHRAAELAGALAHV